MIKLKTVTANHLFLAIHLYSLDFSFVVIEVGLYGRGQGRDVNRDDPFGSSELPNLVYIWGTSCPN